MTRHVTKLPMELGEAFAFVGRQVPVEVDDQDFFIDLLFYNYRLHRFLEVELAAAIESRSQQRSLWDNSSMESTHRFELPDIRRSNLLQLFSAHVSRRMAGAPSEQISGLDREFAALIQVHNTYFSGMKSGARTIGDKLARQIETLCEKEKGWMDESHDLEKSKPLAEFLRLAHRAFLAAPAARRGLAKAMRDAIKQQENIF